MEQSFILVILFDTSLVNRLKRRGPKPSVAFNLGLNAYNRYRHKCLEDKNSKNAPPQHRAKQAFANHQSLGLILHHRLRAVASAVFFLESHFGTFFYRNTWNNPQGYSIS